MKDDPRYQHVVQWLTEQGHSHEQIQQILAKLAEYDARTLHESIFDSIDSGAIDLAAIVKEALGGAGE